MCGIAGFLARPGSLAPAAMEEIARAMATAIRHRGPDDAGTWVDPAAGVAFGHRRLAIVDLSAEGHQPMRSASGRYVICFNGEIYNHRALRLRLEKLGGTFRGHSDTEAMLAAIEAWGLETALAEMNGMFAFALWDRSLRCLHLVRDRLGEKPLYYGPVGRGKGRALAFASELKALRAHPGFTGEIDRDALALYFRLDYVAAPHCIYRGFRKLPAGTVLTIAESAERGSAGEPVAYWSAREAAERGVANPLRASPEEAADELEALLRDAVKLRMEADVPLGAFLSGGVDSSTVVALMQAASPRPVRTFSIGFHEAGFNEAADAKAVARHLGTEHTELYLEPADALAVVPRLPAIFDEPFADSSQIPTHLVSALARRHVTVSLSGDGGDELFGGYTRYLWGPRLWRWIGWMPRRTKALLARALRRIGPAAWEGAYRAAEPLLPRRLRQRNPAEKIQKLAAVLAAGDAEAVHFALVSLWSDPAALVPGAAEPATVLTDRARWPDLPTLAERMMYLDTAAYLPDDILVKVDRASMAVGLEARVPLLDHRLVELAWRLPLALRLGEGESKRLLRRVLYRHVPRPLIERPKMGFGVPIGAWLRGPLKDWAEDLLSARALARTGLLDPAPIALRWRQHLARTHDWHNHLWGVLMFQAWAEDARR